MAIGAHESKPTLDLEEVLRQLRQENRDLRQRLIFANDHLIYYLEQENQTLEGDFAASSIDDPSLPEFHDGETGVGE